ncbi:sodium-dependent transporter [Nocardioides sp. GY 10113]|uniref:sodium-dependent transporter n=1 Tax=Nocardioides sp. GY 10113 TaxID=2569761 RepID=UPI0010A8AEF5|nr:sodium-dependent transporter [Nocardioides sp. GY 10113]TIC81312.1 sodium-dependent transporter [Nocardioides sp. GY 10113]
MTEPATSDQHERGSFASRRVFILAAIGSAVGLGNIWRFPYVAYENGGGAFVIPYLVALLTAGLPFLLMDYGIGHRYRGSAPLSFRRMHRGGEVLGWWQVGICAVIAVYYAVIIAWAVRYTFFSFDHSWGEDPNGFFFGDFLQVAEQPSVGLDFVPGVLWPLLLVWIAVLVIMVAGVQRGIGAVAVVFIPVLVVAFAALVVRALFLPGAAEGLDALFTPDWGALGDTAVWAAAFGQIFFSLSVGFGIMITYASYVGRRTDMTGSGLVVGFSNSAFELLAGIGVFAALGFLAQANGVAVNEVASDGLGLAFVAFPTIISEAPAGALIGVLFFGCLVLAGLTSLVSVIEVVISAVRDKLALTRVAASLVVGIPTATVSVVFFATTTGVPILDTADHFINRFGILLVAVCSMVAVSWWFRDLHTIRAHLNEFGSFPLGTWWSALVAVLAPIVLTYVLVQELVDALDEPYGGYPDWLLNWFGWGAAIGVVLVAAVISALPWSRRTSLEIPEEVHR